MQNQFTHAFALTIIIATLFQVSLPTDVAAQNSGAIGRTVAGSTVVSWPVDPYMTPAQEKGILDFLLSTESVFEAGQVSLETLAMILDAHLPTQLDRKSLEEIGLTGGEIVTTFPCERGTCVGGNLLRSLDKSDLTISICHTVLFVTTRDAAETKPLIATRIYDITPLIDHGKKITRAGGNYQQFTSSDWLMESIQQNIEPDTWEALGGPSTMSPNGVGDRVLLTVTAMTETQLNLQAYLDGLNHASRPSGSTSREQSPVNAAQQALATRL